MFIDRLINQSSVPALEQLMQFTAARHQLLVSNIANIDTPGYRAQDLSVKDFQQALGKALKSRQSTDGRLVLKGRQARTGPDGRLQVAAEAANRNVVFADQANRHVEREMAALAENTLTYNIAAELLRKQFDALKTAIRQRL